MIPLPDQDPFYVKALAAHRELSGLVSGIATGLDAVVHSQPGDQAWSELPARFEGLLLYLKQHFAEEEAGGLLEEAICRLPRLGPQATVLERQHEPLLRDCSELVERAEVCGSSKELWKGLAQDYGQFIKALLTHEAAENRLAEQAFNAEIE